MRRDPDDSQGRGNGREDEDERYERGDQRPEDEEQHDDGDRDRDHQTTLEIVLDDWLQIAVDRGLSSQVGRAPGDRSDRLAHLWHLELCCCWFLRRTDSDVGQRPTGLDRGHTSRTQRLCCTLCGSLRVLDQSWSRSLTVLRCRHEHERRIATLPEILVQEVENLRGLGTGDIETIRQQVVQARTRHCTDDDDH